MGLYIQRHRAEQVLEELAELLTPKLKAELEVVQVSIGYGIRIVLKEPPAANFEWIAVYRGIPVIYDQSGCELLS